MEVIDVSGLAGSVPARHFKLHARQLWASGACAPGLTVTYNFMEPDGGAEMHTHEDQSHVFYVLAGEMKVSDGTGEQVVGRGSALVVRAGEAHQVTGTGKMPCEYLLVTASERRSEAW